jgi:hypothetical protein
MAAKGGVLSLLRYMKSPLTMIMAEIRIFVGCNESGKCSIKKRGTIAFLSVTDFL